MIHNKATAKGSGLAYNGLDHTMYLQYRVHLGLNLEICVHSCTLCKLIHN